MRFFEHRHLRYIFDFQSEKFRLYVGLEKHHTFEKLHALSRCVASDLPSRALTLVLNGRNSIDVEVKGYIYLLFKEVLHPFFMFQVLAIGLWIYEDYIYYAACILFVSLISIIISLVETRQNLVRLRDMVLFRGQVERITSPLGFPEQTELVSSEDILPGDVIVVPPTGITMSCDAVLLTSGCVVNESMLTGTFVPKHLILRNVYRASVFHGYVSSIFLLRISLFLPVRYGPYHLLFQDTVIVNLCSWLTGESAPVPKTALPAHTDEHHTIFDPDVHKLYTLFCGTVVLYTRSAPVRALVVRTGFKTSKGDLVRSILFPKEAK